MRVVPSILTPLPVKFTAPVCPCKERTPVLVIVGLWAVPEVAMPFPATTAWKRLGAVRIPLMSTFLLNLAFSRKKLSTLTVKTKRGLLAVAASTVELFFLL